LVSSLGRSQARPSPEHNARRSCPRVDGAGARSSQRAVTRCVRTDLSSRARPGAYAVPDRVAHDPGTRPSACRRVDPRADRRTHRLCLALRLRGGLPSPPRSPTRPVASKGDGELVGQAGGSEPDPRYLTLRHPILVASLAVDGGWQAPAPWWLADRERAGHQQGWPRQRLGNLVVP